jgi:hypothetical protein
MASPPLIELFHDHVGPSMARHLALLRAVEGLPCHVDLKRGEARFGDRFVFNVQLLGIEDLEAAVWTWSWALPEAVVAPALTRMSKSLQAWGKEHGYAAFTVPTFNIGPVNGDELAILARGMTRSDTFLVAKTTLGMAYLLIPNVGRQVPLRQSAASLAEVIPRAVRMYRLQDHRRMVRSLLAFEDYELDETRGTPWQASRNDGSRLTVAFDEQGRVSEVDAYT